jgi:hypothetical protein
VKRCPQCDQPRLCAGVLVDEVWPEPSEARFASLDDALRASARALAKLFAADEIALRGLDVTAHDGAESDVGSEAA